MHEFIQKYLLRYTTVSSTLNFSKSKLKLSYVENQAILEPILLYRGSKCKQTKEQDSEDCL